MIIMSIPLRNFIREARPNSDKLHEQFRTWLDENPTSNVDLDQIVAEDQLIDYEEMIQCLQM